MEIIPIDSKSIKIQLTYADMKMLSISCDNMDHRNNATRRAIRQVLERAKNETGFDTSGSNIEVRMHESKDGGCELFVKKTNLSIGGGNMGYIKENYRISPEKTDRAETVSYGFDSIDDLICACKQLSAKGFCGESRAYFEPVERGRYFLIITDAQRPTSSRIIKMFSFLSEFGQKCDYLCADSYIKEHFGCICEKDAVKIIAENC